MMTEKQAHAMARRYPREAHAGWLLACDAPVNIKAGARMIERMTDTDDLKRAYAYRNYCWFTYQTDATAS